MLVCITFTAFSGKYRQLRSFNQSPSVHPVSPWRFLFAFLLPIYFTRTGLNKKSLDVSGAVAALVVGFVMTISNYCFCAALIVFFITGSKVTKFKAERKRQIDPQYQE
uniref:Transmembrane protein 19 n=1 Tax=Saccoglossus kowalevskii TaxID=10224 RepID=A0ABM0MNU2_SACKO